MRKWKNLLRVRNIADTNPEAITKMMVGSNYNAEENYEARTCGNTILNIKNSSGGIYFVTYDGTHCVYFNKYKIW